MSLVATLYRILTPAQRRRYAFLQAFFVFAGFVQVAGVGSIAPFIALVSDPSLLHSNQWVQRAYTAFGFTSDSDALIALAFGTMAVVIASNLIAAGTVWAITRFSFGLGLEIQQNLFSAYLYRDYVALARTNSSSLIANITQGTARLTYMVLQPLLTLVSQAMIVVMVIVVLILYQPTVAISVALIVGGGYYCLYAVVRRILARHGKLLWSVQEGKQRLLTESLSGLKEIRLSGTEEKYRNSFSHLVHSGTRSEALIGMLGDLPKFVFETLVFCALLGLAVVLLRTATNPSDIVTVLSLYAMAGYRMLPAAQSVFKSAAQIRANADIVFTLLPDILEGRCTAEIERKASRATETLVGPIVVRAVAFSYPGSLKPVLSNLSVEIRAGEMTVLVGHSGSGKSTFADLLLGLLRPDEGRIEVAGRALDEISVPWRRSLGYVPQNIFLLDDTIAANIAFGSPYGIDADRLRRAAALANFESVIAALPERYDFRVGERGAMLSGGQRQRLGIARALYHDASVLILDEATSALDGASEHEVLKALLALRKTKTIIMIAHRMSTIAAADRVLLIEDGRIAADGSFDELMGSSPAFRRLAHKGENAPQVEEAARHG